MIEKKRREGRKEGKLFSIYGFALIIVITVINN